ncbi:MAG TPA: CaiB/BaiF CoA-transferase family protein [Candidatus Dormibacteraeota bacterium]|nr:CaiB/BaiF CoA-transferase family protein [Candidatus Dormibacteraeota bacterium]
MTEGSPPDGIRTPRTPLGGMRVLDLCRLLPGDFATWVLADLGADVIKVEDTTGGDYMRWTPPMAGHSSAMFWAINRGKRCVKLDLKQDAGKDVLLRLVDSADALLEGFRPGVMDRLSLGYDTLSKRNPSLVYAAITGYGQDGPLAQRAGHDLLYNSLAGLQGITGTPDALAVPGFQIADMAGGGLGGALSVVSALLMRERDPKRQGCFLDVSMFDGVSAIVSPHIANALAGGDAAEPGRMALNGGYACYRTYRAADGRWMALAALEPKFWKAFCELVDRPDLIDRGLESGEDVYAEVGAVIASRTRAEWEVLLMDHDVMLEPVNTLAEAVEDPQAKARGLWIDVGGDVPQPAPVVRLPGGFHADPRVAEQGADTDAVLAELGYSQREIDDMRAEGII